MKMLVTWRSTRARSGTARPAIARFVRPSAMRPSTSRSRSVSDVERTVVAAAAEHLGHHLRVEDRAAGRHALDGVGEPLDVGQPVLEQVADALGAAGEQLARGSGPRRTGRAAGCPRRAARRRIVSAARRPSSALSGGMRTSMIATSGVCARTLRSRSSASPACATTSKPASSSRRAAPSRSRTASSAITIRMGSPRAAPSRRSGGLVTSSDAVERGQRGRPGRAAPSRALGSAPPRPSSRTSTRRRPSARTRPRPPRASRAA